MTCLENIIVISTMFIVLVTIQATKAEGKLIKFVAYLTETAKNEKENECEIFV